MFSESTLSTKKSFRIIYPSSKIRETLVDAGSKGAKVSEKERFLME
jgi:hypothetical protein